MVLHVCGGHMDGHELFPSLVTSSNNILYEAVLVRGKSCRKRWNGMVDLPAETKLAKLYLCQVPFSPERFSSISVTHSNEVTVRVLHALWKTDTSLFHSARWCFPDDGMLRRYGLEG